MSTHPILHTLHAVDPATANDAQKAILDQAVKAVGFLPNMYANMVNAPAVLSTYLHGYALFRSESGLKPAEQEVVFLAVSQVNGCTYCTAAHSMIADKKSGVPAPVLQAIRAGQPIPDARLAALTPGTPATVAATPWRRASSSASSAAGPLTPIFSAAHRPSSLLRRA